MSLFLNSAPSQTVGTNVGGINGGGTNGDEGQIVKEPMLEGKMV
jgi:hypothetical protein